MMTTLVASMSSRHCTRLRGSWIRPIDMCLKDDRARRIGEAWTPVGKSRPFRIRFLSRPPHRLLWKGQPDTDRPPGRRHGRHGIDPVKSSRRVQLARQGLTELDDSFVMPPYEGTPTLRVIMCSNK